MSTLPIVVEFKETTIEQSEKIVLEKVNFDLVQAEICYIIGKSGSGKSSLLKSIYGEAIIKEGAARVLDYDLRKIKRAQVPELRRRLGMVFQDFYLFKQWTVAHNLSFVMVATDWRDKTAIRTRVEEVLNEVGLLSYFNT